MHQQVKFLLRGAKLHIRFQRHGIQRRQQRIKQLVNGNRQVLVETRTKILALEHPRQPVTRAELHHFLAAQFSEPFVVVTHLGFFLVEDLEHLLQIRFRVLVYLLARQRRARLRLPGGIADHRRKIADQENCSMAQVLKLFEFPQHHGVAQMDIRRRGVHAQIHAQRLARLRRFQQLRLQLFFADNFRDALFQDLQLFLDGFEFDRCHEFLSGLLLGPCQSTTSTRRPSSR
jgi:hypothetical protein